MEFKSIAPAAIVLLLVTALVVCMACCIGGSGRCCDSGVAKEIVANSVYLKDRGAGTVIRRGDDCYVWTARHVVDGQTRFRLYEMVYDHEAKPALEVSYEADVEVASGDETDLAILKVRRPAGFRLPWTGAVFSDRDLEVGETALHVGSFLGDPGARSLSRGVCSYRSGRSLDWWGGNRRVIFDQFDGTAMPGSSGGGVFNAQGRLAGVLVGGHGPGFAYYVPRRCMAEFATQAGISWAVRADDGHK